MNEDNKINSNHIIKIPKFKITHDIREVRLEKKNPGFNLVSLKARHRLNIFKQLLSKDEYKEYIRKCKNMYSVSSLMNSHCSLSDLYLSERSNIPEIRNLFNKIDANFDNKKITLNNNRNNLYLNLKLDIKNLKDLKKKKTMTLSGTNLLDNKNNTIKNELNTRIKGECLSESKNKNDRINTTISYNDKFAKKLAFLAFKRKKNEISRTILKKNKSIQNSLNDNNIKKNILDNNDTNNNNISLIKNNDNDKDNYIGRNNLLLNSLLPKYKINDTKKHEKININEKIEKSKETEFSTNSMIRIEKLPLSNKKKGYSITHFGAIKYNNSIFRNKGIANYLPQYYNLPLLYQNSNMNKRKNEI